MLLKLATLLCFTTFLLFNMYSFAQDELDDGIDLSLPGATKMAVGEFTLSDMGIGGDYVAFKGEISVPENRAAENSRNIRLYFYQIKARKPSKLPPVAFLPGGPGGFYNDDMVKKLCSSEVSFGPIQEARVYLESRDILLINQRGAREPDRSYGSFIFFAKGGSLEEPQDNESRRGLIEEAMKQAVKRQTDRGVDLAGFDIMNMVEDINDIRKSLKYDKLVMRGNSFGSQWSMSYIREYGQHVDRAILSGTEPIDNGYDSPDGIWNVFRRLEAKVESARETGEIDFPKIKLTEAIKAVIERLEKQPATVELELGEDTHKVAIGVDDFRNYLLSGINAGRESRSTRSAFPKFVYEAYNEDYRFIAFQIFRERRRPFVSSMQGLLIDNSLGISKVRDQKLDNEAARRWLGDVNLYYKATRDVTPTPVVTDEFRNLKTDIPVLLVHGNMDLSTPIENAKEVLPSFANVHLITVRRGTHGAFFEAAGSDEKFLQHVNSFLNADLASEKDIANAFELLPKSVDLREYEFSEMGEKSLFETATNR